MPHRDEPAPAPPGELTRWLRAWRAGDEAARDRLIESVYADLRRIASAQMRRERHALTLGVTGLVHEAFLRLADQKRVEWRDRVHFFGVASSAMRRVLVDRARARAAAKRSPEAVLLTGEGATRATSPEELLDLDRALDKLGVVQPRLVRVVEMRWFAGLEMVEIAEVLGVSDRTVKRDWAFARAWLIRELEGTA